MRGRGIDSEVCAELRKMRMDVCRPSRSEVERIRSVVLGLKCRRYKLWWSGNSDGMGGVGVLMKEELCEKIVEV